MNDYAFLKHHGTGGLSLSSDKSLITTSIVSRPITVIPLFVFTHIDI